MRSVSLLEESLVALGRQLRLDGYTFITPTPETHARILRRGNASLNPLRNIFGWSRGFHLSDLPAAYRAFVRLPLFYQDGDHLRSKVRYSTLDGLLVAHSAFPTSDRDAVFFGPDTYRFCRAISEAQTADPAFRPQRVVDVGTGSGAGGLYAARLYPSLSDIVLSDVSSVALEFSRANAAINDLPQARTCLSDVLESVQGDADLIISNPPYLADMTHRVYRDGGGQWGRHLALRILTQALNRLTPNGRLLLYTGTPVMDGRDMFFEAAQPILDRQVRAYRYDELDPDVFGEELESPPYDHADRIATAVLHVRGEDLSR